MKKKKSSSSDLPDIKKGNVPTSDQDDLELDEDLGLAPEIVSQLPDKVVDEIQRSFSSRIQQISLRRYSSPLPPADEAAKLEAVLPGSVDRMLTMTEKAQQHQHGKDNWDVLYGFLGQSFSFVFLVILVVAVCVLAYLGSSSVALALVAPTLLLAFPGVISAFTGKRRKT